MSWITNEKEGVLMKCGSISSQFLAMAHVVYSSLGKDSVPS